MPDPLALSVSAIMSTRLEMVADTIPMSFAAKLLIDKRVAGLPVTTEEGELVGVLSWRDVLEAVTRGGVGAGDVAALTGTVREYMTGEVLSVGIDATVGDAARLMARENVRRVLVVDGAGNLAGLVSAIDVVRGVIGERAP